MGRLYRGQPVFSSGDWLPALSRLPNRRAVAITFDDGPTPETTPAILDLLRRYDAPATFFLTGERASAAPHLVQAIVDAGHDIYAHSWRHIRLQHETAEVLYDEMERTEAFLARFRPTPSTYLVRLPYASGIRDPAVHRKIAAWAPDAQLAAWTYATPDDRIPVEEPDMASVERRCAAEVDRMMARPRLGGAILLTHEKGYDVDSPFNAAVAPLLVAGLLPRLQAAGLSFERLSPFLRAPLLSPYVLSVSI